MKAGISVFFFTLVAVMGLVYFNATTLRKDVLIESKSVAVTIYEHDSITNEEKTVLKKDYTIGSTIDLSKYNGSDITIESIELNGVEISRDKISYEIVDKDKKISKEVHTTNRERIEYNKKISIVINEHDPFGPQPTKPRYSYSIMFAEG